jgi:excisionase family DNA binding protein
MSEIIRMMKVREVAEFLRLTESTVCLLASKGKLPGIKIGKSWRFDMGKLEGMITRKGTDIIGTTTEKGQES